ncbi:MAG: gliding motility-associated C-terminal domain-containing protein [Lewinella sp.]|nr:gliding motility-associated C-terminal domain-containing protein [Lewinella sp.]
MWGKTLTLFFLAYWAVASHEVLFQPEAGPVEICNNAIDDDGDGLIDINDPDCKCPILEPTSLIPNPSFEDHSGCCPSSRSQLNCADVWIQASEATTDYLHTCGWMGWDDLPPPLPFPDGQGCIGFRDGRFAQEKVPGWKEYTGACLVSPLKKGNSYRFRFSIGFTHPVNSPPINVTFFGSTNCNNLPFGVGDPNFGCPTNGPGWKNLGAVHAAGANAWLIKEINIVPTEDIYAIAIGPDCPSRDSEVDLYYFFDNLILAELKEFEFQITPTDPNKCAEDFSLQVPYADTIQYQWYKNGIALIGETGAKLKTMHGDGIYQVMLTSPTSCKLTGTYNREEPVYSTTRRELFCEGDSFFFNGVNLETAGTYYDTLQTKAGCDSIIVLNLKMASDGHDTIITKIFDFEYFPVGSRRFNMPGIYNINLVSKLGCDSLVYLDLDYYHVYSPTAFSPNDDGLNDYFNLFGDADLVAVRSLMVFDRWGSMVYSGKDLQPNSFHQGWNGKVGSGNKPAPEGLYVYKAEVLMDDGKVRTLKGGVNLIK